MLLLTCFFKKLIKSVKIISRLNCFTVALPFSPIETLKPSAKVSFLIMSYIPLISFGLTFIPQLDFLLSRQVLLRQLVQQELLEPWPHTILKLYGWVCIASME